MRKAKTIYSELAITRSHHLHLHFSRDKGRQRSGTVLQWRKEGFRHVLIGGCWPGKVVGWKLQVGQIERGVAVGWGYLFGSLLSVLSQKWRQNLGKLSVINFVLYILGQLLQKLLFSFLDCYKRQQSGSCKSDLQKAGFLGGLLQKKCWFPGSDAVDCRSEFYFYRIWPLSVDPLSQDIP